MGLPVLWASRPPFNQLLLGGCGLLLAGVGLVAFNLGYIGQYIAFLPLLCLGMVLLVEVADDFFLPLLMLSSAIALVYAVGLFALPLVVLSLALTVPLVRLLRAWGWFVSPQTIRLDPCPGWRTLELLGVLLLALSIRYLFYRAGGGVISLRIGEFEAFTRLVVGELAGWMVFSALYGFQHRLRYGVPFTHSTDFANSFLSLAATGLFLVSPHAVIMSLGLNLFGVTGLYVGALPVGAAHILLRTLTLRRLEIERQNLRLREMAAEQARNERLVAIGQMSSAISHQILQKVGLLGIQCDVVQEGLVAVPQAEQVDEVREQIRQIDLTVKDLNATLSDLLVFSRDFEPHLYPHSIGEVLAEAVTELNGKSAAKGVSVFCCQTGERDYCWFDRIKLKQALLNLIANAVEASPPGGKVEIQLDTEGTDKVSIAIADEGGGIAPENMENIFSPFFSTKEKGTGLGLTLAQKIIDLHCGRLMVYNNPERGCTFTVDLPRGGKGEEGQR
jgi:signal transduction histidine kinase